MVAGKNQFIGGLNRVSRCEMQLLRCPAALAKHHSKIAE
jgi:hypothetical protein